jgi:hypothetical protein
MNGQLEHNSFRKTAFQGGFFAPDESGAADMATTGGVMKRGLEGVDIGETR